MATFWLISKILPWVLLGLGLIFHDQVGTFLSEKFLMPIASSSWGAIILTFCLMILVVNLFYFLSHMMRDNASRRR